MRQHPPKNRLICVKMTKGEREMLRALAVRSAVGSDSGYIRKLIREAWIRREEARLARR